MPSAWPTAQWQSSGSMQQLAGLNVLANVASAGGVCGQYLVG